MKKHLLTCWALLPFLLFSQQIYVWNASSGAWQDPANWLPQRVTPSTDDILEFGTNTAVIGMPATDIIGRLRIHNSAIVEISSSNLSSVSIGHGSISGANFIIEAGASLHISGTGDISFDIITDCTGWVEGNISFAGGAHRLRTASPGSLLFRNGAEFSSRTGFSGNAFGTTNLNSVIFQSGATYISTAGATPFGAATPDAVAIFESGSTYIHRTNAPVPALAGRTYGNLVIEGNVNFAGIGSARDCTIQNNFHLRSGFFSFKPNTIASHSGSFMIGGDIICEGDTWIDIGNINMTGSVILTGTNQLIGSGSGSGTITILNLTKNNHSTTLYRPLNITGNINLQNGKLISAPDTPLILHSNAGISSCDHNYNNLPYTGIGCDNSFVEGPIVKLGLDNTHFAFPVGEGDKVRPLLLRAAFGDFTVRYIRGDPYLDVSDVMGAGIHHISHLEYWEINSNGNAQVELTYYDPNSGGVTDMEALRVVRYDGTAWQHQGVTDYAGFPGSNGAIISHSIATFGYFSLASSSDYPTNPLPLDNYMFTAQSDGKRITLQWEVTKPHDKVVVEKQIGEIFITINYNTLEGNIAFDENLLEGNNIYRLKIFTSSGKVYITDNKIIRHRNPYQIMVYPNPAREKILIKMPASSSISELLIVNISGSIIKRIYPRNQTSLEIDIQDLPAGMYLLQPGQTHFPVGRFIKFN